MRDQRFRWVTIAIVACVVFNGRAFAAPASPRLAATQPLTREQQAAAEKDRQAKSEAALKQFIADIKSADPAKVAAAIKTYHSVILLTTREFDYSRATDAMLAAHKYAEVETMCQESLLANSQWTFAVWRLARARALAFLGDGKPREALAAAKQYYNVCTLIQTNDAIEVVAKCLAKARPEETGIARRFRLQQLAGAATQPSDVPKGDLGEPILPTIAVDAGPYEAAIADATPDDESYASYVKKGNLLLLADRTAEARKLFEAGYAIAGGNDLPAAVENVARAKRAEAGSVGPANAYIVSLRGKK